ncbi:MAG: diguanylate cyclase [Gammaproteobacteria bacterium]|nr:diguanylate cyclase [Gammaproteobacteria bacterium]
MLAEESDIDFHYCQDSTDAINAAEKYQPTVILQDLVMPDIDGMTLLRLLNKSPATSKVPVIVLSSKEDPKIKSEAFENSAADYLVKPPEKIELIARIRAHSRSYMAHQALDVVHKELKEKNAELERISLEDGLTGISNRRSFDLFLQKEWDRAIRDKTNIGLVMIDIDHFKGYNDHYGHQGGDDCLRQVASALAEVVGRPGDMVARYGGEEFVVVLPNTDIQGAGLIAEKLRQKVENLALPHNYSATANYVSISLGVAGVLPTDSVPDELIKLADNALYEAKESGRNRYCLAK